MQLNEDNSLVFSLSRYPKRILVGRKQKSFEKPQSKSGSRDTMGDFLKKDSTFSFPEPKRITLRDKSEEEKRLDPKLLRRYNVENRQVHTLLPAPQRLTAKIKQDYNSFHNAHVKFLSLSLRGQSKQKKAQKIT